MAVLAVTFTALSPHVGAADKAAPSRPVDGLVTDPGGAPLRNVMVFAADAASDRVVQVAASDQDGQVAMILPPRRHNFGVLSASLGVARMFPRGRDSFTLVLRPILPASAGAERGGVPSEWIVLPAAALMRGRVVDERGGGLGGVRIEGVRPTGAVIATAVSADDGRFAFGVPGGAFRLHTWAPGLRAVQIARDAGRIQVVMGIAADVQRIELFTGRVLSFRIEDSIDPEYFPPAPVRAWLLFTYGICADARPLSAWEKRRLKRYWYLDVLRQEPPNPASLATSSCTPATVYDRPPSSLTAGFGDLPGF